MTFYDLPVFCMVVNLGSLKSATVYHVPFDNKDKILVSSLIFEVEQQINQENSSEIRIKLAFEGHGDVT